MTGVSTELAIGSRPVSANHARSSTEVDARVGLMVKMRRIELDLSQEKVAGQLGITAQQLQKYERGTNRIGASRLFELSKVLDVPVQYFFEEIKLRQGEGGGEAGLSSALTTALEDASTVRLLRMFAAVRDPGLKARLLSIVEAVIGRE